MLVRPKNDYRVINVTLFLMVRFDVLRVDINQLTAPESERAEFVLNGHYFPSFPFG